VFPHPVVTKVVPLEGFFPAEAHHQDFVRKNPRYPYVVYNDLPKLEHLEKTFPELLERK
jgi:peptide-methionine (S)-S-oxide reductase